MSAEEVAGRIIEQTRVKDGGTMPLATFNVYQLAHAIARAIEAERNKARLEALSQPGVN